MPDKPYAAAGAHIHPPFLLGGLMGILLLYKAFSLPSPLGKRSRLIGVPLLGLGLGLGASAVAAQLRAGTTPDPTEPSTALVQSGPYRFTRNPIYLGMALIYSGMALLLNAVGGLALLPGMIFAFDRGIVRNEESYLEQQFGQEYLDYKQRVPRWI